MRAAPTCRRNTDARWLPPPGLRPVSCPRCCLSQPHSVALLVSCQRVGADAHHPAAAVCAVLAVFVEEVEAQRRAAGTDGAVAQAPRPA